MEPVRRDRKIRRPTSSPNVKSARCCRKYSIVAVPALIDFDLLHARIGLHVNQSLAQQQIFIELLRSADVEDRVRLAIQLDDSPFGNPAHGIPGRNRAQ